MKRVSATTTTTRPNHRGSMSTSTHSQKSKSTEGAKTSHSQKSTSQEDVEREREKEREAAFMSSLLADLDDDYWTAAPSSSPQGSPVKSRSPLKTQSTRPGCGVGAGSQSAFASTTTSGFVPAPIPVTAPAAAPAALPSTKSSSSSITTSSTVFRTPVTPVKNKSTKFGHVRTNEPRPLISTSPNSTSNSTSTSSNSTSISTSSNSTSISTSSNSTSSSSSTLTEFDINAFLQGCEDWDLGDGALSPVKPVSKPIQHVQPFKAIESVKGRVAHPVPHARGGAGAGAKTRVGQHEEEKQKQKQTERGKEGEREEGEYAYTSDPCTRCVVLAVEDVCVDGGSAGGRKRWEKHIKALARVASSEKAKAKVQEKEKEEVEVEVVLCDGWYETDVRVDDVFNVIGHFSPPLSLTSPSYPTQNQNTPPPTTATTPTIHLTFTSSTNSNSNLLILHPDLLLTATALSSAAQCARKPVLSGLVRQSASGVLIGTPGGGGDEKASPAMVYGNVLHEVLDRCLVADRWGGNDHDHDEDDEKWMNRCIDDAIRGSLGELVGLGLEEEEVRREIRERARGFGVFARRYLGGVPKEGGILNNTRTLAHDAPSRLAITHLLDIEEDIWSPAYGIKGKIDAVVRGIIDDPVPVPSQQQGQLYNSGLTRYTNNNTTRTQSRTQMRTRNQRHTPLPLELKTGRVQTGMDHRAQTMLYTLLLSERYNVDVRDGLLFYSRLRSSDGGDNGKLIGEDIVRVPRGWNEIRGLIGLRNGLAAYMWRRIRKRKDDDVIDGDHHDIPNRKEDVHIEKEREREIEEDFLPPPIDDEWTCKRCYALDTCLLFRKTHPPTTSHSHSSKPSAPVIPPPGRLRQLFDAHTAHLTPARVEFFRKWEKLLALEERDMVRFKRELWVLGASEREKRGRCLGGMRVVGPGGVGAEGEGEGASMDDLEEDGDEGKWGKEGKIYRFVYTFEKDLDFLHDGGDNKDDNNVSLQHTHLVKGDPITVSLMSPRQVLALARGYILDFQLVPSSSSSSSSYSSPSHSSSYCGSPSPPSPSFSAADLDIDVDMDLNFGVVSDMDTDEEVEDLKSSKNAKNAKKEKPRMIGRVVVGVDHSLHPWLDGGVGGGMPLGRGFGPGRRKSTAQQHERYGDRFAPAPHHNHNYHQTQTQKQKQNRTQRDQRAVFRIDKDELFGGMSRVRENLASLFYASGPVSVPPPVGANGNGNGQHTTTTKMGRGNKKLLELVVDLREPVFDCDDEELEEDVDVDINTAEARYLKVVRDQDLNHAPSDPVSISTWEKEDEENQDSHSHQKHDQKHDQKQQHQKHGEQQNQQPRNSAQQRAIERALSARDYALILGMPGTGKTCVIAALVRELVFGSSGSRSPFPSSSSLISPSSSTSPLSSMGDHEEDGDKGKKPKPKPKPPKKRKPKTVLISSYTHSAVDSILRKLVEGGGWDTDAEEGRIVRLGNVEKIHPEVRRFSPTFSSTSNTMATGTKRKEMTAEELENIYMNASVVATTCLGLDHPLFSRRRFDYCILDEASQITLPTCLGPLRFADVFVLVGDHHQLPPLVKNPLARLPLPTDSPITAETLTANPSLTTSLFLLLSTAHPNAVVELTEQYRMEEDIMTISNELVYGGRMRCGFGVGKGLLGGIDQGVNGNREGGGRDKEDFLSSVHRAAAAARAQEGEEGVTMYKQCRGAEGGDECWLERVCDDRTKAIFINTDALGSSARESRVGDLVQNLGEAALVTQFVETLRRKGVEGSRVGVVTLYRQQVKVLEGLLNGGSVDKKGKEKGGDVEIMTADKSQGRDKDCVVVSLVRSNDTGRIGDLVKDWRRINVSFTRARFKLVIFGSRRTLEREPMLGRFFELMDRKGWVLDLLECAERAHEGAWGSVSGGGGRRVGASGVNGVGVGTGKKRRCGWEDEEEEDEDEKGKTMTRCGRNKENDPVTSLMLMQMMEVDDVGVQKDKELEKAKATRPAKRVRLEDNPEALLKGRPVLRDLVGNEMCL